MFSFFAAVAVAVARMMAVIVASTVQTFADILEQAAKAASQSIAAILSLPARLFGGGGALPAPPIKDLQAALPGPEKIAQAQDLEIGKAMAAENILKASPERQVQIFAATPEEERMSVDLTMLSPEQFDWLHSMSEAQLKAIAETSERRIAMALAGERDAITAIRSVGQPDPSTETALANRIAAFRAGTLGSVSTPAYALH